MTLKTGILNPGEMGSFIAASARNTLGEVFWCSAGRSERSRRRAEEQRLSELTSLPEFCARCELIVGVCPPHAALEQAQALIDCAYKGIYLDANAVSPATARELGEMLERHGIAFVDGGIVGLPSYRPGTTWLYLSGPEAARVAGCFSAGPVETEILGRDFGQASALKMCYAAWNKGKNALLSAIMATADDLGVRAALEKQWDVYDPGFSAQSHKKIRGMARKAWRFGPEMEEIAATLAASSVPSQFFDAAAELYRRESAFKDIDEPPGLEEILRAIRSPRDE